jgi:hypothetical protein
MVRGRVWTRPPPPGTGNRRKAPVMGGRGLSSRQAPVPPDGPGQWAHNETLGRRPACPGAGFSGGSEAGAGGQTGGQRVAATHPSPVTQQSRRWAAPDRADGGLCHIAAHNVKRPSVTCRPSVTLPAGPQLERGGFEDLVAEAQRRSSNRVLWCLRRSGRRMSFLRQPCTRNSVAP